VIREHTYANLLIGLVLSLLIHTYIVVWGPPFSMPTPALRPPPEVEVQLREWPAPPPITPPLEAVKIEEPPPAVSTPVPAAKPALPPNTQALQDAVQTALTPVPPGRVEVQLPERLPSLPTLDSQHDPIRLAEGLRDSLQYEPRLSDVAAALPDLPVPERQRPEAKSLPALPTLAPPVRRETAPSRPATIALPSPQVSSLIKGPAAERQVIFQPPPPSVTVESESEIELRFWILPNGAVGRVVPVKKSDPRLEALAINYLRHWRFTPLSSDTPQDEQWGIIPFKFRIR
jgi:Gram-negative bacterial TonB protein C-terminal